MQKWQPVVCSLLEGEEECRNALKKMSHLTLPKVLPSLELTEA